MTDRTQLWDAINGNQSAITQSIYFIRQAHAKPASYHKACHEYRLKDWKDRVRRISEFTEQATAEGYKFPTITPDLGGRFAGDIATALTTINHIRTGA